MEERKNHQKQVSDMNEEVKAIRLDVQKWMDNFHAAQAETGKVQTEFISGLGVAFLVYVVMTVWTAFPVIENIKNFLTWLPTLKSL